MLDVSGSEADLAAVGVHPIAVLPSAVRMLNQSRSNPIAENIFWPEGKAPEGVYKVSVNYYAYQGGPRTTPFNVLIQQNGKEPKVFSKSITQQDGTLQIATIRFERD